VTKEKPLRLKSKLLAGASTLVMAGGMIGIAAPPAHAVVTHVGDCGGSVALVKLASTTKGVGLTDQTQQVKITGAIAKDQTSKTAVNGGGTCSGVIRPGDLHVPNGAHSGLTAKAEAISFLGNTSCANGATAVAADATAANAYPPNGKITWTFNQTYVDLTTALVHPYKMQADVALLGFNPTPGPDVVDVGGIVLTGLNAGATVSGSIWEDPVALTHGASGYNTGYELDLATAAGCADGTPNNANILIVLSGGGGASATSLLGSNLPNSLSFDFGEP
jgi:hypothetical protein